MNIGGWVTTSFPSDAGSHNASACDIIIRPCVIVSERDCMATTEGCVTFVNSTRVFLISNWFLNAIEIMCIKICDNLLSYTTLFLISGKGPYKISKGVVPLGYVQYSSKVTSHLRAILHSRLENSILFFWFAQCECESSSKSLEKEFTRSCRVLPTGG